MSHICEWCKEKFTPITTKAIHFCSQTCSQRARFCNHFLEWYYNPCSNIHPRSLKLYLLTIHGNVCFNHLKNPSICISNTSLMDQMPLIVDHIDGNSKNNYKDNIQLLCPNCHSLTPNYKNKNNFGRFKRKIYEKLLQK